MGSRSVELIAVPKSKAPTVKPISLRTATGSLDRVIARSSRIVVARVALESAMTEYPGARLTRSHGARLIDGTEQRQRDAERRGSLG
jgi:hypothetical protein